MPNGETLKPGPGEGKEKKGPEEPKMREIPMEEKREVRELKKMEIGRIAAPFSLKDILDRYDFNHKDSPFFTDPEFRKALDIFIRGIEPEVILTPDSERMRSERMGREIKRLREEGPYILRLYKEFLERQSGK